MDLENTASAQKPIPEAELPYAMPPKKKQTPLFFVIFLTLLFIVVLGVGAAFIYGIIQTFPNHLYEAITYTPTPYQFPVDLTPEPMQQWQTYRSTQYGITFKYPSRWQTIEHFKK